MRAPPRCFALLLSAALAGPLFAADTPAIDPAWRERALTDGRAAHERYLELSERLEVVSEVSYAARPGSSGARPFQASTRRVQTVRAGDCMFREETRTAEGPKAPPETRLECDNADYHFTLAKGRAGYSLADYSLGPRKIPLTRQSAGLPHETAFAELGNALEAIAGGGKYELKVLAWDKTKGLLRIGYTYTIDGPPVVNDLWVDPEHNWRVVESRGETKSGVFTDVYSYGHSVGGLDFPTGFKNHSHYKVNPAPPDLEITGKVISVAVADREPKDFRLSAFGLPEPVDAPPPRHSRTGWFVSAAVALAVLALGFGYLARRRAKSASTST